MKIDIFALPRYSFQAIILRLILVSATALTYMELLLLSLHFLDKGSEASPVEYIVLVVGFNLMMEINLILDSIFDRIYPTHQKLTQRMLIHSLVGLFLLVVLFFGLTAILPFRLQAEKEIFYLNLGIGLFLMNGISSRLIIRNITEKLFQTERKVDNLKQEKLKMDYLHLQDKLNPHFLFNNLTVLKSLTYHNSKDTIPFIDDFTDVYRYVLQSSDKQLVSLREEMEFIQSFVALHKARLKGGLTIQIDICKSNLENKISPLSLQLLVENAIKHNIASKSNPLFISIYTHNNYIVVENNIKLKKNTYSTKIGLKNIILRYGFLTKKEIEIINDTEKFTVKIPLI